MSIFVNTNCFHMCDTGKMKTPRFYFWSWDCFSYWDSNNISDSWWTLRQTENLLCSCVITNLEEGSAVNHRKFRNSWSENTIVVKAKLWSSYTARHMLSTVFLFVCALSRLFHVNSSYKKGHTVVVRREGFRGPKGFLWTRGSCKTSYRCQRYSHYDKSLCLSLFVSSPFSCFLWFLTKRIHDKRKEKKRKEEKRREEKWKNFGEGKIERRLGVR